MAALSVAMGAFGSHILSEVLDPKLLNTYEIGVRYQFLHAITLFALGILFYYRRNKLMVYGGYLLLAGVVLFSGSLYVLALEFIFNIPPAYIGPVTPIGGVTLMVGGCYYIFLLTRKIIYNLSKKGRIISITILMLDGYKSV